MVGRLIEDPYEDESVFSRGRESSTISASVDDPTLVVTQTQDEDQNTHTTNSTSEQDPDYRAVQTPENEMFPTFPGQTSPSGTNKRTRPPRHPDQYLSFVDVGRKKRGTTTHQQRGHNPFDNQRHNPFDTDTSNEGSNSIVGDSLSSMSNTNDQRGIPLPPPVQSALSGTNPFDESSSAEYVEASYSPPAKAPAQQRQRQAPVEERAHSWDSDRQFPVLEIERIKRKTRRMRGEETNTPVDVNSAFRNAIFPRTTASATRTPDHQGRHPNHHGLPRRRHGVGGVQRAEKELIRSFNKSGRTREKPRATAQTTVRRTFPSAGTPGNYYTDEKKEQDSYPPLPRARSSGSYKTFGSSVGTKSINLPPPGDAPSVSVGDSPSTPDTSHNTSHDTNDQPVDENLDLTLHDLCAEATTADDIAWHNALCLLASSPQLASVVDPSAEQFTPLHICCLGQQAPPSFMILGLLYAFPQATRKRDAGGRLPLHLAAASSADTNTMQWLVNEYPGAVSQTDDFGLTPLHLYLRRIADDAIDPERIALLLGQIDNTPSDNLRQEYPRGHVLFRRGSHVSMNPDEIRQDVLYRPRPVTRFTRVDHEAAIANYSPDLQVPLRKLSRWHTKNVSSPNKANNTSTETWPAWGSEGADVSVDTDDADRLSPAAIVTPTTGQLPIHIMVQRVIEEEEKHNIQIHDSMEEYERGQDEEVSSSPSKRESGLVDEESEAEGRVHTAKDDTEQPPGSRTSVLTDAKALEVMRLLVDAFPEGLAIRDREGFTPLLTVLLNGASLPRLDAVLLLLGRRSSCANKDWSVDQDLPLQQLSDSSASSIWVNPAMVSSAWTRQLPLHIVAEEYHSELPLVQAVYEAYPAAIQVQDSYGRTPLHLALSSYRKVPVDPRAMNVFCSETVAQTQDRKGLVPLDVMFNNAEALPDSAPWAWKLAEANDAAVGSAYQRFFQASLLHMASSTGKHNGRDILRNLQLLPQWMRRKACVSTFVQEVLIEEVATPWKSAIILLDGVLLIGLLTVFRLQMNDYIVMASYIDTWYTYAVYAFAALRFLYLGTMAALASGLGQYNDVVLLNLWYWIDYTAMILAIITSILLNGTSRETSLLAAGTVATGLLWWSLIGYISRWSLAMSMFTGIVARLSNYIFYVLVAFGAVIVAFGQMLYTIFQSNCEEAMAESSVCTVRDAYRVVYLMLRGNSLADETGATSMTPEAITMVATFFFFLFLVGIGLFAVIVLVTGQADVDELAQRAYWEPMLSFVMSVNSVNMCGRPGRRTCGDALSAKLGVIWDALTLRLTGKNVSKSSAWFVRPCTSWVLTILSIFIIPIWFFVGLLTLGILWPPQLRRALFRPSTLWQRRRSMRRAAENTTQQIHALRSETLKFKVLSYDRMLSMEKELRELKQLLSVALTDD